MKRTWILLAMVPALLSAVWAATGSRARTQVAREHSRFAGLFGPVSFGLNGG